MLSEDIEIANSRLDKMKLDKASLVSQGDKLSLLLSKDLDKSINSLEEAIGEALLLINASL